MHAHISFKEQDLHVVGSQNLISSKTVCRIRLAARKNVKRHVVRADFSISLCASK